MISYYKQKGFSLVEVLVGSAIFLIVAVSAYSAFVSLLNLASGAQSRTLAIELADEQFEIIRNMPYVSVGLTNGIPIGIIPQTQTLTRGGSTFVVTTTVRNVNLSSTTVQASDKLVEVSIECPNCKDFQPVVLTGQISPANLQSASNGGALVVQVLNAAGQPVPDATVAVQSTATSTVQDTDVTNNVGTLNIIGVPPGNSVYQITVTKNGYSTDKTYPAGGAAGATPDKPNVNVVNQQVTNVSFAIDQLSALNFSSVSPTCSAVPNYHFSLAGSKKIATSPSIILKYPSRTLQTNASGVYSSSSMEWDTYTLTPTDGTYDAAGINPFSPFVLNPNNTQNVQIVAVPKSGNSLMVSVQDAGNKLPISGAVVELSKTGFDSEVTTGEGYLIQTDWSGGSGQSNFTSANMYFSDNGLVDTATSSGNILLRQFSGQYTLNATGTLESSTFDTGTSSNFYTLSWTPANQPQLAGASPVMFQFAGSNTASPASWNYIGPDGTADTYFSVPGGTISSVVNGSRYARYKTYLTTNTATVTPMVSNVSFSYATACTPPGQVIFQGLSTGTYTLNVSKAGYTTYNGSITIVSGWQQTTIPIGP